MPITIGLGINNSTSSVNTLYIIWYFIATKFMYYLFKYYFIYFKTNNTYDNLK